MSHLHLVDGILPLAWWVVGYILAFAVLGFALPKIKKEDVAKRIPYIGVVAALMLLTMSVPLGFLPFHLNLTVLAGILAGPWLGFTAVFIVNIILAFIGHGGITVVGLNTLIIGTEVILGYYLFSHLRMYVKPTAAVAVTVVFALLISTSLMVGLITSSDAGLVSVLPHKHSEDSHEYKHEAKETGTEVNHNEEGTFRTEEAEHHEEDFYDVISEIRIFKMSGWSAVASILLFGIAIEALVTSLVVAYFIRIRPDLIIPVITKENDEVEAPTLWKP